MPGRRTSGFHRPGRHRLHQAGGEGKGRARATARNEKEGKAGGVGLGAQYQHLLTPFPQSPPPHNSSPNFTSLYPTVEVGATSCGQCCNFDVYSQKAEYSYYRKKNDFLFPCLSEVVRFASQISHTACKDDKSLTSTAARVILM